MLFDKTYVGNSAISQSDINKFERDLRQFFHEKVEGIAGEDRTSAAMDIGSLVDVILLQPELISNYYIVDAVIGEGKIRDLVDLIITFQKNEVASNNQEKFLEWPDAPVLKKGQTLTADFSLFCTENQKLISALTQMITHTEYQLNWGADTRLLKALTLGKQYYNQMIQCGDRIMISVETYNKANSKVQGLKENEYTKDLFERLLTESENFKVMKQLMLTGKFEEQEQKGILDFIIIDELKKVIYPWDLKTSANHSRFLTNYRSKKYGRQGAFYTDLLKQSFEGYTIAPFSFLVIAIETDERPEVYEMSAEEMYINENGYTYASGYEIKGWKQLMREIAWHIKTGKWDHRKDYYTLGKNMINSKVIIESDLLEAESKMLF